MTPLIKIEGFVTFLENINFNYIFTQFDCLFAVKL